MTPRVLLSMAALTASTGLHAPFVVGCSKTDAPAPTTDVDSAVTDAGGTPSDAASSDAPTAAMTITSTAFAAGTPIPVKFSCDGDDVSPPLTWTGAPTSTKSFVLIVDDPDAPSGTFTHWVLFDVPGSTTNLAEGSTGVGVAGAGGFGAKYGGPCPPKGKGLHHYFFKLQALDVASVGTKEGASRADVEAATSGHVVARGELMGTFDH